MLIEELIRLGRPVLESGLDPRKILKLITDAADDRVKNFYRHVIVVELPPAGAAGEPVVLPIQNWQIEQQVAGKKKPEIDVDVERAVGAPVSLPAGGNPLNPQGRYGLPVYPVYDPHFQAFRKSADGVRRFLARRLERTPGFSVDDALLNQVAACIHKVVAEQCGGSEKRLGVMVVARCDAGGVFTYGDRDSRTHAGRSELMPGHYLEPDCGRIAEAVWSARVEEGAEMGRRAGPCSVTGMGDAVVAAYCKAWPWAFPTWTCPVPHGGNTDLLVEGIALSEPSYRALTLGANLFHRLTRPLHHVVLPELFAPVENRDRQNAARGRKVSDFTPIYGSAFPLPLRQETLADQFIRDSFAEAVLAMLNAPEPSTPMADRYLTSVTGLNALLPEEVNRAEFRLMLVYFSGEVSRGDVHLRAYIQDVLPSTLDALKRSVRPCREQMTGLMKLLTPNVSDKQLAYLDPRYQSVPYLLARGYGGSHLWSALDQCLHRRSLDDRLVVAHVAARIRSVVPRWPDSRFEVIDEIVFLMVCRDFIRRYNVGVARPPKEEPMPMRPWRELLEMLEKRPPREMSFQSLAELGFACGALLRRFSAWYWRATKVGREGKDYLKHRVITFGTDLSPEVVWRVGLGKLCDVAARYETKDRVLGRTFRERLGVVLTELEQRKEKLKSERDEFMTAFWAGYCLQGYDRPVKPKAGTAGVKGGGQ